MLRKVLAATAVLALVAFCSSGFCATCGEKKKEAAKKELPRDEIIAIATAAVKAKGIRLVDVEVIYDEGGKLWLESSGLAKFEDKSPNHGILKQGFLKNYRIVFFDFKKPVKDVWVFVDKDTGEVLTVFR